ncbi:LysE family translocator [Halomonas sp. GXIMD04776]|uniref:LysE family translocator n=1 Tax=Halomonas sp. GXIMD04776 TaxID=3415605 RepID=UPI003CB0516A
MINLSLLSVFIPTFFMVSLTPGMCMTLSMVLGMTVGVKRALWMMLGELTGVGLVALAAGAGVATLMLRQPALFALFKGLGGAYLAYLGVMMWRSRGRMAIPLEPGERADVSRLHLLTQGFVTAIANPKGWAFFIALLPPFLDPSMPLAPQLAALVAMILSIELLCLLLYAGGGRSASRLLAKGGNVRLLNRIAGTLMIGVGVWLAFG